jgi:hypothetical protein
VSDPDLMEEANAMISALYFWKQTQHSSWQRWCKGNY